MTIAEPVTRFYTFGFDHARAMNGFTFDKDVVVRITAPDPRAEMFAMFGREWSMEYAEQPDMKWYPRGVKDLS